MPTIPSNRLMLNIRIKPEERDLIDRAAEMRGKTRTEFILEAAREAAREALLDRTAFVVDPDVYRDFLARLDAPPQSNTKLVHAMKASTTGK